MPSSAGSTPRTPRPSRRRRAASRAGRCRAAPAFASTAHVGAGYRVPPYYDSMIAKLIVHGATRDDALARLRVALAEMRVEGIATNLPLHRRIVERRGLRRRRRRHPPPRSAVLQRGTRRMSATPVVSLLGTSALLFEAPGETDAAKRSSASGRWRRRRRPGPRCAKRCRA